MICGSLKNATGSNRIFNIIFNKKPTIFMDFTPSFFFSSSFYCTRLPNTTMSIGRPQKYVTAQTVSSVPCAVEIPHICAVSEYQKASSGSASASPRVHPVASANPVYPPHRCFQIHWRVLRTGSGCCCIGEEG